ncbi:MAG: hypothetical protein HOQ05_06530 [Corynebacteriales bacterium]|nr:hypothetical protein [Mycobacteriales bacterium]
MANFIERNLKKLRDIFAGPLVDPYPIKGLPIRTEQTLPPNPRYVMERQPAGGAFVTPDIEMLLGAARDASERQLLGLAAAPNPGIESLDTIARKQAHLAKTDWATRQIVRPALDNAESLVVSAYTKGTGDGFANGAPKPRR